MRVAFALPMTTDGATDRGTLPMGLKKGRGLGTGGRMAAPTICSSHHHHHHRRRRRSRRCRPDGQPHRCSWRHGFVCH